MESQKLWLVRRVNFYTKASDTYQAYDEWDELDEQKRYDCIDEDRDIWFDNEYDARLYFETAIKELRDAGDGDDDDGWHTYNGVVLGSADVDKDNIWDDDTWEEVDVAFAYYRGKTRDEY